MSSPRPKLTVPKPAVKPPQAPKVRAGQASPPRLARPSSPSPTQKAPTVRKTQMAGINRLPARQPTQATKLAGPSLAQQRKVVERKAEMAARNKLYRLGYHSVRRMQYNKLHGIDLGAFKYDKSGRFIDGATAEVKGRSGRTPRPSAFRAQVRGNYIKPRLLRAQEAGVQGADQLYKLAKQNRLTSYGITYGLQDKGKGAQVYRVGQRGPLPSKPIVGE
jgi:hypothetical protein